MDRNEREALLEQLDNLEAALVQWDQDRAQDPQETNSIHLAFRQAHNLKSTLTMAERTVAASLIHDLESLFDSLRSARLEVQPLMTDLGLAAVDQIRQDLARDQESVDDIQQLRDALANLMGQEAPAQQVRTISLDHDNPSAQKVLEARKKGLNFFKVEKSIRSDISQELFDSLPIREKLADLGTVILSQPRFEDLDRRQPESLLSLVLATDLDLPGLSSRIFDPFFPVDIQVRENTKALNLPKKKTEKSPVPGPKKELRILVVEDNPMVRHLHKSLLSNYGHCLTATSGKEALGSYFQAQIDQEPLDLMVLDLKLPDMNGHEVLRYIRRWEEQSRVGGLDALRVIIVSAVQDMDSVREAFRNQSDAYLIKPVTRANLEQRLLSLDLLGQ